jgi:hypothetical protein
MVHGLSPVALAVDHKPGALFAAALFNRHFLGFEKQLPQQGRVGSVQFHDVPDMFFRDHQEVNRSLGGQIPKGQYLVILVQLLAGDGPGNDFAKNTIIHKLLLP